MESNLQVGQCVLRAGGVDVSGSRLPKGGGWRRDKGRLESQGRRFDRLKSGGFLLPCLFRHAAKFND